MSDIQRKLVSIRKIISIDPIEGADNIVCATVDGWKLVTQKSNNFKPDDLVVYFEIDSFLPINEKFEFLRKSSYKKMGEKEGFRLKTIKLRGQISQGLILPLSEFSYLEELNNGAFNEGDDLTEFLGVEKWEPPLPAELIGIAKGNFPSFLQKTDQERIQNIYGSIFETFETTLKLDGSSMTVYYHEGEVGVCSRNIDLEDNGNTFWSVAKSSGVVNALKILGRDIAVQGELMGPGIQGNREKLEKHQFFVFDIFDIKRGSRLVPFMRNQFFEELKAVGMTAEHVPVIDSAIKLNQFLSLESFLDYADKPSLSHKIAEGVVFKSHKKNGSTFKVINNKFLLAEKD